MSVRARWIAVAGLIVLVIVKLGLITWQMGTELAANWNALASRGLASTPMHNPRPFTSAEITVFLAQAKLTRGIADPLQRCLAFPDPPGSHWSHDTVTAYCHYTTQSAISVAELTTLIQNNHADQVDKRFADALQQQRTMPNSRGLVDRTFIVNFRNSSVEMRGILDAWKRQSPNSAFAYAASGTAYVISAHDARGSANAADTGQANFESMGRLLQFAVDDLDKAIALNPRLTAAYVGLVEAGTYGDRRLGVSVATKGLTIDPANFAIYARLMRLSQPKWGGSTSRMQKVGAQAQSHVVENPLLSLLPADAAAYLASGNDCDCDGISYTPDYRRIFDNAGESHPLAAAGEVAFRNDHSDSGLGLVYAAEALRFAPIDEAVSRGTLSFELSKRGEARWGKEEADRLLADLPPTSFAYNARAKAYEYLQDYPHAMDDYTKSFALDRTEPWPLIQMGIFNVHKTHDWPNAWAQADQLIKLFPNRPEGWILRLSIQKDQPRPGFHDTMVYFLAHFSHDPNQQKAVREVRQWLSEGK